MDIIINHIKIFKLLEVILEFACPLCGSLDKKINKFLKGKSYVTKKMGSFVFLYKNINISDFILLL